MQGVHRGRHAKVHRGGRNAFLGAGTEDVPLRRRMNAKGTAVELLSVPRFGQGSFDSLCAYYTGAMMLATLFPEYETQFGRAMLRTTKYMSLDPMISNYSAEDNRHILGRWYYHGETIDKVVKILNAVMRGDARSTRFECRSLSRRESTSTRRSRIASTVACLSFWAGTPMTTDPMRCW